MSKSSIKVMLKVIAKVDNVRINLSQSWVESYIDSQGGIHKISVFPFLFQERNMRIVIFKDGTCDLSEVFPTYADEYKEPFSEPSVFFLIEDVNVNNLIKFLKNM
jgi:hypothetical protein